MSLTIRPPVEHDQAQWQGLYEQYAAFYNMPMPPTVLDAVWGWIQHEDEPFYCLVAVDGSETVLGLMHFRAMHSPLRGAKVGFLDDLFVAPAHRGTGVVDALFDALNNEALQQRWPFVRWITADDNLRAQAVYNRLSTRTSWVTYQLTPQG